MTLLNNLKSQDGLENVVAGIGTPRDKTFFSTYQLSSSLSKYELDAMYRTSWIAKKIVNIIADDMTRRWRTFYAPNHASDDISFIQKCEQHLSVQKTFNAALKLSRLYGGCLIFMGVRHDNPEMPLDVASIKKGDLHYLHVLDRFRVNAEPTLNFDVRSQNFGLPEYYTIPNGVRVHESRVLRFDGELLPYDLWLSNGMWDDSVLQNLQMSLKYYDSMCAALASMLFEANVDVIRSDGLGEVLSMDGGEDKVAKRFSHAALMKSINHMLLLDSAETYEKKGNNFQGLDKIFEKFMQDVCGGSGVPMTRLFGTSASGLQANGDNDVRNYYDTICTRQENTLRSIFHIFDKVFFRSCLGSYDLSQEISFVFPPLWQMSDSERADIEETHAQRDSIYLKNGVISKDVVRNSLTENRIYKFNQN